MHDEVCILFRLTFYLEASMPVTASASNPTSLDPSKLYSLPEFIRCSGISYTRIQSAKRAGAELPTLDVGKRKFIAGDEAIAFVKRLAEHHAANRSCR